MLYPSDWPPPYTIKRHPRAKYVKLRASGSRGIEITVPMRFNAALIPEIIERNKAWLLKQLAKIPVVDETLPTSLSIFGQEWEIQYTNVHSRIKVFEISGNVLLLVGKTTDKAACRKLIWLWVRGKAKALLPQYLQKISNETKLVFKSCQVRAQQSLWGSCTRNKAISLNFRLLFFPLPVIRYVLVHELCHTLHHNHSEKFWELVSHHDPEFKQHRKELKKASQYIPGWIM